MTNHLPPFQIDYEYLTSATTGADGGLRDLSAATIHMALAALGAMHYNRYWRAGDDWLSEQQQQDKNDLVDRAIYELMIAAGEPLPDGYTRDSEQSTGDGCGGGDEDNDDMEKMIIYTNDGAYLAHNHGCGNTRMFLLNEVGFTVTAEGETVIQRPTDVGEDGPVFTVADDYMTCFSGKAVPYLLGQALEYFQLVDDIVNGLIDLAAGPIDELYDWISIARDLLGDEHSNIVDTLKGWTTSEVEAALTDSAFVTMMTDSWTYTGSVSRQQLKAWVDTAPVMHMNAPVQLILQDWAKYSLPAPHNKKLAIFAAECETGNTMPDILDSVQYSQHEYNGDIYPIWDVRGLDVDLMTTSTYTPSTNAVNPVGLYGELTANGEGAVTASVYAKLNSKHASLSTANWNDNGTWTANPARRGVRDLAIYDAVVSDYTGQTWTGESQNNSNPGPLFDGPSWAGPIDHVKLTRVILVGAAL